MRWLGWGCCFLVACLFPDLSGLNGSGPDASPDAPHDGGTEAEAGDPAVVIAQVGSVQAASGNAQQNHIVWTRATKAWWLFYIDDDTTTLKTRFSQDFNTWSDGASLTLPYTNAGEGRNFGVAYALIAGTDVVHITMSHVLSSGLMRTHVRATIALEGASSGITFGPVEDASSIRASDNELDVDAPSTTIDSNGTTYDATGWAYFYADSGVGNANAFVAQNVDMGSAWTFGFTQENIEQVPDFVNARQVLSVSSTCSPDLFWEKADVEPDPTNVRVSCRTAGSWMTPVDVFASAPQDVNDWCAAWLASEGMTHVVRSTLAGTYDHVIFAAAAVQQGIAPPTLARQGRTGITLVSDGIGMLLVDIGTDENVHGVKYAGGSWATWTTVDATARSRNYLSGASVDASEAVSSGGSAIIWTQTTSGGYEIAGMRVKPSP